MKDGFVVEADGPTFRDVARHMFKAYDDDDGRVYCVSCDRVMASAPAQLESHFRMCDHGSAEAEDREKHLSDSIDDGKKYTCGTCAVAVDDAAEWTHHFGTADHWRRYVAAMRSTCYGHLFTYRCGECGVTLYDTEDAIERHAAREHHDGAGCRIAAVDRFMAKVYAALALSRGHGTAAAGGVDAVHCCAGCETVDTRPVHAELQPKCGDHRAETFYCAACRVTIVCDARTYRRHRLSPEHAAMSEDSDDDDDGRAVPRMLRRLMCGRLHAGFDDGSQWTCRLCGYPVRRSAESHVPRCRALRTAAAAGDPCGASLPPPPCGKSRADYAAFRCGVCGTTASDAVAWSRHLQSAAAAHAKTPHRMAARAYFECTACRTLYYGPRDRMREGPHCVGAKRAEHRYGPMSAAVADLMRFVYRDANSPGGGAADDCEYEYYYEQRTGRYGRCDRSAAAVPFYCPTCRLEFYGDRGAFRRHALTAEHVLIRLFATVRQTEPEEVRVIEPIFEHTGVEYVNGGSRRRTGPRYPKDTTTGLDAIAELYGDGRFDATPSSPTTFEQLHMMFDPISTDQWCNAKM